uniref:CSON004017 protein n=1 Tax=Culicoides sonorensis TaxID=179676 RepID=A0A336M559_CULSO
MRIICETTIVNRAYPQAKNRAQKSTVAIGTHPPNKENTEFYILVFTAQNKTGIRFKIKENLQKVFTKCLQEGKMTISFKVPEHDLQIKCDPVQLKAFMNVLKLALEGKTTNEDGRSVISHVTKVTKHEPVKTKLVIHSRKDYPIKGLPRTLTHLEMSGMKFCRVDNQVYLLKNLKHLDLNTNIIEKIPDQLGTLRLRDINLSSNKLAGSSWKWLLGDELSRSLFTLNLSDNELTFFPNAVTKLKVLTKLVISKNKIKKIPFSIRNLKYLRNFDVSSNELESLPQNINLLRFDTINLCDNLFPSEPLNRNPEMPSFNSMPSLFVLAARRVICHCIPYSPATLPRIIIDTIEFAPLCPCRMLCYDSIVHEKVQLLRPSRWASISMDRNQDVYVDSVFCSQKCFKLNRC